MKKKNICLTFFSLYLLVSFCYRSPSGYHLRLFEEAYEKKNYKEAVYFARKTVYQRHGSFTRDLIDNLSIATTMNVMVNQFNKDYSVKNTTNAISNVLYKIYNKETAYEDSGYNEFLVEYETEIVKLYTKEKTDMKNFRKRIDHIIDFNFYAPYEGEEINTDYLTLCNCAFLEGHLQNYYKEKEYLYRKYHLIEFFNDYQKIAKKEVINNNMLDVYSIYNIYNLMTKVEKSSDITIENKKNDFKIIDMYYGSLYSKELIHEREKVKDWYRKGNEILEKY